MQLILKIPVTLAVSLILFFYSFRNSGAQWRNFFVYTRSLKKQQHFGRYLSLLFPILYQKYYVTTMFYLKIHVDAVLDDNQNQ